ncbi:MAG TPA: hypothetical protein VGI64_22365 [Streptosporangiaceae bacterium]|jgi:hypothetical protein
MTDLLDRLASLEATSSGPPSEATVAADLGRGRAALRRGRLRAGGVLSAAVLAAGAVAAYAGTAGTHHQQTTIALPQHGSTATRHHQQTATKQHQHGTAGSKHAKIKLVDYSGQEPPGFNVASVPQGFGLQEQSSTGFSFILAPPSADHNAGSFIGKLVVTAEAGSELGDWQHFGDQSVTINGNPGRIGDDGTATQLWFSVGNGVVVDAQAWDSIGMTHQQLVDFANGVTTTPALQLSHG